MPSPLTTLRLAERRRTEAFIAALPCAARLHRSAANGGGSRLLPIRTAEPQKARDLRLGGLESTIDLEGHVALPLGSPAPQPQKEFFDVVDIAGEYRAYAIVTVQALRGVDCYRVTLRARKDAPTATRPTLPG